MIPLVSKRLCERISIVTVAIVLASSGNAQAQEASFYELPGLGGVESIASPYDVSFDGSTIVGQSLNASRMSEISVWTNDGGVLGLGQFERVARATGVSADGSVVVGTGVNPDGQAEVFRWTADSGLAWLGRLGRPASFSADSNAVSDDGQAVAGYISDGQGNEEAIVWTMTSGMTGLGSLGGDSRATAISADGSTVVGYSTNLSGKNEAFVWTVEDGMQGLGTIDDGASWARSTSADGTTIVGSSRSNGVTKAFVWTSENGMEFLPELSAGYTFADIVSSDGSIIIGRSAQRLIVWRGPEREIIELSTMMTQEYGVDLTGWDIEWVGAISGDNGTIVGTGTNPAGARVGWVFVIPKEPVALLNDLVEDVAVINIENGISNSLDSKLDAAIDGLFAENADQRGDSVHKLNSFINAVEAQRGKKISDEEADYLVGAANRILDLIEE